MRNDTGMSVFDMCVAYVANVIVGHKILILKIIVKNKSAQMMHKQNTHERKTWRHYSAPTLRNALTSIENKKKIEEKNKSWKKEEIKRK